jgi:hypothetical protein
MRPSIATPEGQKHQPMPAPIVAPTLRPSQRLQSIAMAGKARPV